jgi:hypothetical protein
MFLEAGQPVDHSVVYAISDFGMLLQGGDRLLGQGRLPPLGLKRRSQSRIHHRRHGPPDRVRNS